MLKFAPLALLIATPAFAAECNPGAGAVMAVTNVYAEQKPGFVLVAVSFINRTQKIIRMAHATLFLEDALGYPIGEQTSALDMPQIPRVGDSVSFRTAVMPRLTKMRPQEIVGTICADAVLYEDGEKVRF